MNEQAEKLLSLSLSMSVIGALFAVALFGHVGVGVAAAGNTYPGTLSGGNAETPTATQQTKAVANMPTAVIDTNEDADVTVGYDYSETDDSSANVVVSIVDSTGTSLGQDNVGNTRGTTTITISSSDTTAGEQDVTAQIYNTNSQETLAKDTATLQVRNVGNAPTIDMRDTFQTRGNGNTDIQVGYNATGELNGKKLEIEMSDGSGHSTKTNDLSATPRGSTEINVPSSFTEGSVTFELHIGGVDSTPEATDTAKHALEPYISAQDISQVNGTDATVSNIDVNSETRSFGTGGFFQFTLVDSTQTGFSARDLNGSGVGADESTLMWVNFTVENYDPDVLMGPGDVEKWQKSTSGGTADIDILVHPTTVYRNQTASGFNPNNWKSDWDLADDGFDAHVGLSVADMSGGLGSKLDGARLNTDAQQYRPPAFNNGELQVDVAAPHCKDNATSNTCSGGEVNDDGFYNAVIPESFWSDKWRSDLEADDLAGSYTNGGTTEDLDIQVTKRGDNALVVNATNIHYSSGEIKIKEDDEDPTADAGSDQTATEGTSVTFDGSGSTDNNDIASYEWDTDDDGNYEETGTSPTNSFSSTGDKTVTLRVTDGNDNTDTDTMTVSVSSSGGGDDDDDSSSGSTAGATGENETVVVDSETGTENESTDSVEKTVKSITAGDTVSITNISEAVNDTQTNETEDDAEGTDSGTALENVNITFNSDQASVNVAAGMNSSAGDETGAPSEGETIDYLEIETNTSDDDIEEAEFDVRVSESEREQLGVSPDSVVVYRYHDGEWDSLDTTYRGDDRYQVSTPGFSVFAVGTDIRYDNATLATATVAPGEQFTGEVDVTNSGPTEQTVNLTLDTAEGTISTGSVDMPANTTKTATISGTLTDAGTYELAINGDTAGTLQVTDSTAEETTGGAETTAGGSGPGFTVVATLIAVLSVAFALRRRHQTR